MPQARSKMPLRWKVGDPQTDDYFYDEPIPAEVLSRADFPSKFPPNNMSLSDAWVVKIVESDLAAQHRVDRWPAVFGAKYLVRKYVNKGQAAKTHKDNVWKYDIVLGIYQMHGEEGRTAGLTLDISTVFEGATLTAASTITLGIDCLVKSNYYAPHALTTDKKSKASRTSNKHPAISKESASSKKKRSSEIAGFANVVKGKSTDAAKMMATDVKKTAGDNKAPDATKKAVDTAAKGAEASVKREETAVEDLSYDIYDITSSEDGCAEDDEVAKLRGESIRLQKVNQGLQRELEQAEGKFALVTQAFREVNSVINPISALVQKAQGFARVAAKLIPLLDEKNATVQKYWTKIQEIPGFARQGTEHLKEITTPGVTALRKLKVDFPGTTIRIHAVNDAVFKEWFDRPHKLIDVGDNQVDANGNLLAVKEEKTPAEDAEGEEKNEEDGKAKEENVDEDQTMEDVEEEEEDGEDEDKEKGAPAGC